MTNLNDSFSLFIYAFKGDGDFIDTIEESLLWSRSAIKPDQSYLFNHVQNFFAHNQNGRTIDRNQATLYELKSQNLTKEEKEAASLFNKLFNRVHSIDVDGREIDFNLLQGTSVLSPTILYVPLTKVGLLSFSFQIAKKDQQVSNLLDLNYALRVLSRGKIKKISTAKNLNPQASESETGLEEKLEIVGGKKSEEADEFVWSTGNLVDYFMTEFDGTFETLSPSRLQAFVYASLDEEVGEKDLSTTLFRLRRLYSESYVPEESYLASGAEVSVSLDKIYYGASVEGAVVLVKKDEKPFFKNYSQTVINRTVWTYLLAYHQRYALISAASDAERIYSNNNEPPISELTELIDRMSKVQLKCLFGEISHYSQQNDFYHLCFKSLNIDALFREVKEEVTEIHQLVSEQRRQIEERRIQAEEKRTARNQQKLEWLIALLILPQIWLAVLSTGLEEWEGFIDTHQEWFDGVSIIGLAAVIIFGLWIYVLKPKDKEN